MAGLIGALVVPLSVSAGLAIAKSDAMVALATWEAVGRIAVDAGQRCRAETGLPPSEYLCRAVDGAGTAEP